jgi:hypothetical protein
MITGININFLFSYSNMLSLNLINILNMRSDQIATSELSLRIS